MRKKERNWQRTQDRAEARGKGREWILAGQRKKKTTRRGVVVEAGLFLFLFLEVGVKYFSRIRFHSDSFAVR